MHLLRSTIGWTQISRSDVSKATEILRGEERGIRDEIGFLALHQGFANRFFPGTSVLQTRLRYALFVPWQMTDAIEQARGNHARARAELKRAEQRLVSRLLQGVQDDALLPAGIIGSRSANHDPGQPPSTIYWSALREWRVLQPLANRRMPTRDHVLATGADEGASRADDGVELEVSDRSNFYDLPDPPKEWSETEAALSFRLELKERLYLRDRIGERLPSLLARMATAGPPATPWRKTRFAGAQLRALANNDDREALRIASYASALAHIGRAVYSALVEHVAEEKDGRPIGRTFREALGAVVAERRHAAMSCNIHALEDAIRDELGPRRALEPHFRQALEATKCWLTADQVDAAELLAPYLAAEKYRKPGRARLADFSASPTMRQAWLEAPNERTATGLGYRWHRVGQLIDDLHAA